MFLNDNERRANAAERHWIVGKTAKLNQPIYLKDDLTSEWSQKCVALGER